MTKLSKQMVTLARQVGGSFKTVSDRSKIVDRFANEMFKLNVQIRDIKNLKPKHIALYINNRQLAGISKRTLQNEMSAIRSVLTQAGKTTMAKSELISNKQLGLANASRDGTKIAITSERFHGAFAYAENKDIGVAAALQLARVLGLRTEEAVQSAKSLKTWKKALANGDNKIKVIFGTKGGRPRDTTIVDREKVINAVNYALKYANEHNGKLIDKPDLKSAIDRYRNILRDAGLKGKFAPHSLRYAWAVESINYHQKQGMTKEEARAMASMDLGHGDGRGRYVERIYSKTEE